MKNMDSIEIRNSKETKKIIRMPASTRKKVKQYLNEGSIQISF